MVSDDANADPAASVALVASRLFGTQVTSDAVIGESLERATDPALKLKTLGGRLAAAVNDEIPDSLSDAELRSHPLSVWIELEIGLEDKQRLTRRPPTTLTERRKNWRPRQVAIPSVARPNSRPCSSS